MSWSATRVGTVPTLLAQQIPTLQIEPFAGTEILNQLGLIVFLGGLGLLLFGAALGTKDGRFVG